MRRITDLDNYVVPDANNFFGRIKDTIFDIFGAVSEQGSKVKADWLMDILSIPYFIAAKKGISLTGVADTTSASQAYDLVFGEVSDKILDALEPITSQLSLSVITEGVFGIGSLRGYNSAAAKDKKHVYLYWVNNGGSYSLRRLVLENGDSSLTELIFTQTNIQLINITANDNVFCVPRFQSGGTTPKAHVSSNGTGWSEYVVDVDTARNGGTVCEPVGGNLIIAAFDDPDNSYYTSSNNGQTWVRASDTITAPLNQPIVSASNGLIMQWAHVNGDLVRQYDGSSWVDCTIVGGGIGSGLSKNMKWTGDAFAVYDLDSGNAIITNENDLTTYGQVIKPTEEVGIPTTLWGGGGIVGLQYEERLWVATSANARAGLWHRQDDVPVGAPLDYLSYVNSFDGSQFYCLAQNSDDLFNPSVLLGFSKAVQR